jgi:hypothetical protein
MSQSLHWVLYIVTIATLSRVLCKLLFNEYSVPTWTRNAHW